MSKIEFAHQNSDNPSYPKGTIAVQLPTVEFLRDVFSYGCQFANLDVGLALCSPEDNFERSVGRTVAFADLQEELCSVEKITIRENGRVVFHFTAAIEKNNVNYLINFGLSINNKSKNVRMEYGYYDREHA